LFAATLGTALLVWKTAGSVVSLVSLGRVVLAAAAAIALARHLPVHGKLTTLVFAAVVATVYVALLLLTRELGKADLAAVRTVLARGKRG
jgi:stage V sporulation protein B